MPVTSVGGSFAQVGGNLGVEPGKRASAPGRQNDVLMWALLFILAAAPLPLGSNRPFFWTASATAIGLVGAIYFAHLARRGQKLRVPLSSMRLQIVAFAILCGYLVLQMLPIAGVLGIDVLASMGDVVIRSDTISVAPGTTFLMLLRMMTYGLFFFLVLQLCRNEGRRSMILNAILAIIAVYALIGLVSLRLGDTNLGLPKWAYFGSATGTFVNRNSYATFLAFGICIAATLLIRLLARRIGRHAADPQPGDGFQMVAYAAVYLLLLTTVVATQSRMGLFVSLAGTVTPLVLSIGLGSRPHATTAVVGLLGSVVVCGAVLAVFGSGVFERLGGIEKSAGTRFNLYDQILTMIANRPLTGTGGGTFDLAFPLEHELPVNPDVVWDKAHNTYLALWSELGLVFGSLPLVMFLLLAARLAVSMANGRGQSAQTIALAVLIVGGLHSLVDFSLEIQANTFIFLALTAVGVGAGVSRTRDDVQ